MKKKPLNSKGLNSKGLNSGGNPELDRKESMKRFEVIKPFLEKLGYKRVNQKECVFINEEEKKILAVTSAPSQTKMARFYDGKFKSLQRKLNGKYSCYIYFSRNYDEWSNKTVYISTLKSIQKLSCVSGIFVGLNNLSEIVSTLENTTSEILYIIK
jgi:hypothetical protein